MLGIVKTLGTWGMLGTVGTLEHGEGTVETLRTWGTLGTLETLVLLTTC